MRIVLDTANHLNLDVQNVSTAMVTMEKDMTNLTQEQMFEISKSKQSSLGNI